ncbi:hypothetical protein ACPC54_26935 [Kitasatospora sp. NPDC094028]
MSLMSVAESVIGAPREYSRPDVWGPVELRYAISLPEEYKEFVSAYGPGVIGSFLGLLHPGNEMDSLEALHAAMCPLYREISPVKIPYRILPDRGGAFLWGLTTEGDACFLIPDASKGWRVGIWFRQWAQWWESEQDFSTWMADILSGGLVIEGFLLGRSGTVAFEPDL